MRQTGTIVLIIGIIGLLFFGIKAIINASSQHAMGINTAPQSAGFVPMIISVLVIIVGILMFLSAGRKIRK
ncbi:MAG TPA: hypothetical protein VE870_11355 [Bacteroidales bacterium]|nr:hypothetical protein [Bacteroidales bacterium]